MTDRPPAPSTPQSAPTITAPAASERGEDRVVTTTSQLAAYVEESIDCRVDETTLEEILVELDRRDYVEWVTVTRAGDYVWDLTESPDRIAEAVAEVVVDRLRSWIQGRSDD